MVDVIPLCVDTYLLADVIAMWQMLKHIWFEVDITSYFLVVDVKPLRLMLLPVIFLYYWLMLLPIHLW